MSLNKQNTLTTDDCKKMLFKVGITLGVSPKLISERLLDDLDKGSMLRGEITIVELEESVKVWMGNGMPTYSAGKPVSFKTECHRQNLPEQATSPPWAYRKPFA